MQIVADREYTFSFTPSGVDLSNPFASQSDAVVSQLQSAGFPLAGITAKSNGLFGGYLSTSSIDVTFTYQGAATDDVSLGNAMADNLTESFSTASFTYAGATAGAAKNTGLLDTVKAAIGITSGGSASSATSLSTIAIIGVAILLLAVAVYSFAGAAAEKVA